MSLLFAPQTVGGRPVLVQFRAGTMSIENGTAIADTKKGFVSLIQTTSGLLELWWQPADSSNTPSSSTIITFGDATFEKVEKVKDGVVFALCLNGSKDPSHTRLFWMQEANASTKEAEIVIKMKKLIGDAECRKRLVAAGALPAASPARGPTATTAGGSSAAAAPASSSGAKGPITNEALQAILQSLTHGGAAGGAAAARPVDINLQQMLGSDEMLAALREDPAFYATRVGEHLPPPPAGSSSSSSIDIVSEIRNPQASAAAATLQAAVSESPNTLNEVLTAFGLPKPTSANANSPAITQPTAAALLEAIIKDVERKKESPAANPDDDNANGK